MAPLTHKGAAFHAGGRALERQIGTLYYERLLASTDRDSVTAEAQQNLAALPVTPREFVRDPG